MNNYVVYHLHTEVSLLDSCTNYKLYVDKAVELGQKAICFTEHGNIYNWIEKKMYANSKGLKYLHGIEMYLTEALQVYDEVSGKYKRIRDNYHTILIAKNYKGFKEINKLTDLSTQKDHFYHKPRISFDEFKNISDNVIKISACLASPLNKLRDESLIPYYDFLEVQPHVNSSEQKEYNKWLYEMSKKYNKPLIAGTDTHSIDCYKAECREILLLEKNIEFSNEDTFDLTYKSYDELVDMFKLQHVLDEAVYLEAINNTNVMANMVTDFELDTSFKYPVLYDNEEEVLKKRINRMYKDKCNRGIIKPDKRYKEMAQEEMRVFKKIGMVGFMLFMSKLVCWCWENGIPVGYCRGSVGGSMIAYLTDIIDVNPLKWDTIFSRFANESRKEIGDIDLDISPDQRHLVFDHIIEEFGLDKTAYVLSMQTISDKGTIDAIGRALKIPLSEVKIIKKVYESNPKEARDKYPNVFYYFDGLVNTCISQSMHAAGIVVSPLTLPDNYGTFWNDGKRILSVNMDEIHEVSLVKYDILGLKNIQVIRECCELAGIKYPKSHELNWDDQNVWEHITDSPVGIFQFESPFAYQLMKKFKPRSVDDLSIVNGCLRPSGESFRNDLMARKFYHNPSQMLDDLLKNTYGRLLFQEQTIQFLTEICGFSGSEADSVRRGIARKKTDILDSAMPKILEGYCAKSDKPRDVAEKEAKKFLQIIEDSSNYQFGKNHSTGYSMIGYLCGYLRYYYPVEFITAYLNNANNDDDINMGTSLAQQMNIPIQTIKFRHSLFKYTCDKTGIYKGLGSIKYLSEQMSRELYELRDENFDSFIDLLVRLKSTSVDSRQLEILVKLDFFKEFGEPNELWFQVQMFDNLYGKKLIKKNKLESLFLTEELVRKHSERETEKQFSKLDSLGLIKDCVTSTKVLPTSLKDRIFYQGEYLGYIDLIDSDAPKTLYYVTGVSGKQRIKIELYEIYSGKTREVFMWKRDYERKPFNEKEFLTVKGLKKENKRAPSDKINQRTGKPIWVPVQGEYEYWLAEYERGDGGYDGN